MQHIDEQYIIRNFDTALKKGYIKAYYQPVIRTLTEQICSVEALARWQDPEMGLLSPYLFITVLEKNRLIHKLDLMILENICYTYNEMREKGLPLHPFSINLSRLDFNEMDMLKAISDILEKYNVPSTAIHIEITESVMLDNTAYFRRIFDSFHEAGFAIFMDDFGSGYSSLNVLKDYSFDVLKIDMRFLSDIGMRSKKILSSVVNMAKAIGIHTLAEGVETREQILFLRTIGCEMLQGYYYSKPMSSEMYIDYLSASNITVEKRSESDYWDTIGKVNFLSPDPFNEISSDNFPIDDTSVLRESPTALALIEIDGKKVKFQYANRAYLDEINKLGYNNTREMEEAIESMPVVYFQNINEQIEMSLKTGKLIKKDHFANAVYFTYSTKCIAKTDSKYMLAASIKTFDPARTANREQMFEKYSRILIDTYDHITIIDHENNRIITRLYSKIGFTNEYLTMPLDKARVLFAQNEVIESERERFIKFTDISFVKKHIEKTENPILQQPFHIKNQDGKFIIRDIRIIRTTVEDGERFLFVIQSMSPSAQKKALEALEETFDDFN
ncbi:EAL domain, c-di-GMP-specific phosphodiesterase class I (or its enzymatically inactive variant) [Ruminococcus flavefaciens]|uniref:EAL domain, c-di-GMP-specific phosphodiesterase class I (Or its enzymatically inactive variant) n=1 Tax=Ruminococcus flavefaciens TaxID=1265 RepID=A0A1H6JNH2_RUMFL|nr:EAL domain-containing protein [Ruminococcus flavefaciens]SEH63953.1 EAL domain, c-di-GMP-specific phosphodiesterase class I (or its enzymatically inactive variant) [Ruminococcus flavefaciens]